MRNMIYYGDLIRVFAELPENQHDEVAKALGFERKADDDPAAQERAKIQPELRNYGSTKLQQQKENDDHDYDRHRD